MKGSLRTRLIVGAVVWMTAVLVAVIAGVVKLTRNHPEIAMRHATHITMGILAVAFVAGGLFLVRKALAPFHGLRANLSSLREGRSQRIEGDHPSEVQPLVNDLNALLEDRERAIARALTTAGDLAHGLKTPLACGAGSQRRREGHQAGGDARQLVERMQRQIDYHLARARATASARATPGLRCPVLPSVEGLVRTMRRLHAGRELAIDTDVSPAHEIRGQREDLDEMLGNLLDNACKWARARVAISSSLSSSSDDALLVILVDDASGLDPSCAPRSCSEECGRSAGPGIWARSGLVSDLVELYGGSVTWRPRARGDAARLQLPRFETRPARRLNVVSDPTLA